MLWPWRRQHGGWRGVVGPLALALAIIGALWGGIVAFLSEERHQLLAAAGHDSANLARAFEESIVRAFESVDETLIFTRELYLRDPEHFDLRGWARRGNFRGGGLIAQISLIGPDGLLRQSNLGTSGPDIDLSDRPHFRIQRTAGKDRPFISVPVLGRNSGIWTLNCTRRVTGPNGAFLGAVVVSLDISYLTRFYDSIAIGHGSILLVGTDGVIRAAAPLVPPSSAAGDSILGTALSPEQARVLLGAAPSGSYSPVIRGRPQLASYRRLEEFPLVVAVALDRADVLAPFRQTRLLCLVFGLAASLVVALATAALVVLRRRQATGQEALAVTLANVSQGVVMVDALGRVPVLNRRAVELLGLPALRPAWRWPWRRQAGGPAAGVEVSAATLRRLVAGELPAASGVCERETGADKAGQAARILEIRTRQLSSGARVHTCTDITERRANERALAAARDAAEAAGRARSAFLAVMSHEIRTPLNGILGVAELLAGCALGETERRYVRLIAESGGHLMRIIDDVLDFSRLDAARLELEERPFDPHLPLSQAVELMAPRAAAKGLELTLEIAPDVPRAAVGDARRIVQVLLNLIGNAVKFTTTGGVRVCARRLAAPAETVRLEVAVRDSGIGIPLAAQVRLFQEFSQVDSSVSRRFGGSGLGLAISRRLVERMGGSISVTSTPGEGSTFRFDLTLRAGEAGAEPPAEPSPVAVPRGLRVLLVEDNATNRLVITRMLERMGVCVTGVGEGAAAVAALREASFDLVFMDVMMPGMDGLQTTREIRALGETAGGRVAGRVPIIGLSAAAMRADEEAALAAGMDGFTAKPVRSAALAAAITRVLAARVD